MGVPARTGSSPAIRRIPRPPAAASAAEGRGIHGSRRLCRLGVRGGGPAGGAAVEKVVPEWILLTAVFPSVGAAPCELRRGSAVSPSSAALRSAREGSPFAGVQEVVDPAVDILEGEVAERHGGVAVRCAGWRCSGTEERRLPVRDGGAPSPSYWRWCGGFRRRDVVHDEDDASAQKDLIVIFMFSGLFCMIRGWM